MSKDLTDAAKRASRDTFFLGHTLEALKILRGWNDTELAGYLQCQEGELPSLALCRRPISSQPQFKEAINAVAEYVGGSESAIETMLLEVEKVRTT